MTPEVEALVGRIAAKLLGSVNAPEQEIYRISREVAALSASAQELGWRTMESARTDGSRILIATREGRVCEVWWAHDYEGAPGYWMTPFGPGGRGYTILPDHAVAWQPLPAARSGNAGGEA